MQINRSQSSISHNKPTTVSIVIPTYNEAENILKLIEAIKSNLPYITSTEIIVVDDNSPDGTGRIVENYIHDITTGGGNDKSNQHQQNNNHLPITTSVKVINRQNKRGLISAILQGIESSAGEYILVMDADFSHSPELIPSMLEQLSQNPDHIVVASRYVKGGSVVG
ncbi:MAG: glycosyltransferase, partial [Nitrososphaeraceae archaeon]